MIRAMYQCKLCWGLSQSTPADRYKDVMKSVENASQVQELWKELLADA